MLKLFVHVFLSNYTTKTQTVFDKYNLVVKQEQSVSLVPSAGGTQKQEYIFSDSLSHNIKAKRTFLNGCSTFNQALSLCLQADSNVNTGVVRAIIYHCVHATSESFYHVFIKSLAEVGKHDTLICKYARYGVMKL